jgi:uncharacterized FlaG/YvyC family protein
MDSETLKIIESVPKEAWLQLYEDIRRITRVSSDSLR